MRLIVAWELRAVRDAAGDVWSAGITPAILDRYLVEFDEVLAVARLGDVERAPDGWHRLSGARIGFHAIPHYVGPAQYLRRFRSIRRSLASLVQPGDAVMLRVPSQVATLIAPGLWRSGHPYGVEVVGDPWDVFAPGTVDHPLRPLLRRYFRRQLRRQAARASAASYVTEGVLQRRYPVGTGAFTTSYSSIDLPADVIVAEPRAADAGRRRWTVAFVGSLAQLYKAPDVLVRAVRSCVDRGLDLDLEMVGGGKHLSTVRAIVAELGLGDRVRLHGELPGGEPIRRVLDGADLFVLPSRTEGLPRAMIEAMARGLPCIGTTVGGIPELLAAEDLVPPDDAAALADAIAAMLGNPARMATAAHRNLARARDFEAATLRERRGAMYRHLREATERFAAGPAGV